MRLYVLRHGKTPWNKEKRFQGQTNIPLAEEGVSLARKIGEGMKDIQIDYCFSSPLARAVNTAVLVLGDRDIPVVADALIKEISFGELEGKCVLPGTDVDEEYMKKFYEDPFNCPPGKGGETFKELCDRAKRFTNKLIADPKYKDSSILISCHGACGRAILNAFSDTPEDFWLGRVPKNCAVSIIDIDENGTGKITELDHMYA